MWMFNVNVSQDAKGEQEQTKATQTTSPKTSPSSLLAFLSRRYLDRQEQQSID
jgi:hypothetical protein